MVNCLFRLFELRKVILQCFRACIFENISREFFDFLLLLLYFVLVWWCVNAWHPHKSIYDYTGHFMTYSVSILKKVILFRRCCSLRVLYCLLKYSRLPLLVICQIWWKDTAFWHKLVRFATCGLPSERRHKHKARGRWNGAKYGRTCGICFNW